MGQIFGYEEFETTYGVAMVKYHKSLEFKTVLSYAGGKVIAEYRDYLGVLQDYNGEITFEYDGLQITAVAVGGIASIDFASTVTGSHIVRTANAGIDNGEVIIVV